MTNTKQVMRKAYLARLQGLAPATLRRESQQLTRRLLATPVWRQAQAVALTMSQSFEVDTSQLIRAAWIQGKVAAVPRTRPQHQLEFVAVTEDTEYQETHFGVLEPVNGRVLAQPALDLVVVPGLAFTATGRRLGFGGGYYDRYLADYPGKTVAMALTTQLAQPAEWPVDDFDVTIDQVLLPVGN